MTLMCLALLLGSTAHAGLAPPGGATWTPGQPGETLEIELLTMQPGEVYWQRYGHNAILVRDRATGAATLYNYGIFDFNQKNFFWNFLRGHMLYRVVGMPPEHDLANYAAEGRAVEAQRLNLSPPQRVALRDFLEWNARPENAEYRYDYFVANCSTRVRDALDRVLDGALRRKLAAEQDGSTFRDHALRLMAPDLPLAIGIHAGLAGYSDRSITAWERAYVPAQLQDSVSRMRIRDDAGIDVPLVAGVRRLLAARLPLPPTAPPAWFGRFLGAGLLLGTILALGAIGRRHAALRRMHVVLATLLYVVAGLVGIVLVVLWLGTEHQAAWRNENLLLFNPLCLLALPALLRFARPDWAPGAFSWRLLSLIQSCALLALLLKLMPQFGQDNADWIAFWLPIHFVLGMTWTSAAYRRAG